MASLRKAVDAHCKNCIYDKAEPGTWREQVENCTATGCNLHPHRPMTMATVIARRKGKGIDSVLVDDEDENEGAEELEEEAA